MKKQKISLQKLKIKSFITETDIPKLDALKAGNNSTQPKCDTERSLTLCISTRSFLENCDPPAPTAYAGCGVVIVPN